MTSTVDARLLAARSAADRHVWQEAYDLLSGVEEERDAPGAALELLAEMAWWVQRPDGALRARERAYAAYLAEGDPIRAAFMALLAAQDHNDHLAQAIASGWLARAARLLADQPESFAHGYLAVFQSMGTASAGDLPGAIALAADAVAIGARVGDKDVQALGLVCQGSATVHGGNAPEGLLLLDEATAAAVSGELSPFVTGVVYCHTISTCRDLADYRRAGQWTEVAKQWCERQSISGFPGVCRVHRAEIMALHGEWTEAEQEASRASSELMSFKASFQAAEGYYTLGEIRLRTGDLPGADEAFRLAQDLGRDPQPGRALYYLAQGRTEAAVSSIQRTLAIVTDRLSRARMLAAQVEIAIAAGDIATAREAATEARTIADAYASVALQAAAHTALGAVHVAAGEPDLALAELTRARAFWQATDAPYELARTRMTWAEALRQRGEIQEAVIEAEAAEASLIRLGAMGDLDRAARVLDSLRSGAERGERQQRAFMFTDIVGSTELLGVIGDEAWSDLKRWHDQTLRTLAAGQGGEMVNEAGDGFFFAFRDARSAVASAVAMQRTLAEHRRAAGFAPRVRIGIHVAEATKVDGSYVGQGVHEAARIGSVAGASEIVISAASLDGAPIAAVGEARMVQLKGIAGMTTVHLINWTA